MKTVLVVEDEKMIRQGLVTMIRRAPTPTETVLEAKNGLQALEILQSQPVDLLVTDIRMPGMDGIELVAKTKSLPHIPLAIVVSGYDDFHYAVEMLRSGVRDYLLKPVEREKLHEILARLEEELQTVNRDQEHADALRRQALRCLMLDDVGTSAERQELLARYSSDFGQSAYQVFCSIQAPEGLLCRELLRDTHGWSVAVVDTDVQLPAQCAGVSDVHTSLDKLHTAYTEALAACQRAYFDGPAALRQAGQVSSIEARVSETELQKMVQLLGANRYPESFAILRQLTVQVQRGRLAPGAFAQAAQKLGDLIRNTYHTILETDSADLEIVTNVWQHNWIGGYLDAVSEWMEQFNHRLLNEFDDYYNKQKIRDAVIYIREHYATPLNMAIVSNQVNMNYSLFSLLFKQYVGTNFVSYLQRLRLNEAKRLLRETNLRVNEIGRRVGFSDDKNFLKVFKASEGVSPSEYRRAGQFADQ